jgi:excisionase family DNA binding protein
MSDQTTPTTPTAGKHFPSLMTAQQAADRLQISEKTITRLVKRGTLRCYRLRGTRTRRFDPRDVERLLVPSQTVDDDDASLDAFITQNQKG